MVWYTGTKQLTLSGEQYCRLLEELFQVQDQRGVPIPYVMTPYQKEWHAESINILDEEAPDILAVKARGISFTTSFAIDFVVTAMSFKDQILPVISQRFRGAQDILKTMAWVIRNCKVPDIMKMVDIKETEIYFRETNTVIRAYPSGNAADAVRGRRLIRALIDEYAFQNNDKALLVAVQDTMQGRLGQVVIGSTPNGRHNSFADLCKNPAGFSFYSLPVFDPYKFNPSQSILTQDLEPIAPWIDLRKLEERRLRDQTLFEQEYMCSFIDDSLAFYPLSLVVRCQNPDLVNLAKDIELDSNYTYQTKNKVFIGVDVARSSHFTAISVFEQLDEDDIFVQRALFAIRGKDIPTQVRLIVQIARVFSTCVRVAIDETGLGLGLYEYVKKELPAITRGISFASSVRTGEYKQRAKIRDFMLVNMKNLMESGKVELIDDDLQEHHMTMMTYDFNVKEDSTGHGDILFANAMALLPLSYASIGMQPMHSNLSRPEPSDEPQIMTTEVLTQAITTPPQMTLGDKIKWLKKHQ